MPGWFLELIQAFENVIAAGEYPMLIDLEALLHPSVKEDDLASSKNIEYRSYLSRVIPAERADLHRADIPIFTARPDCCDLFTSQGEAIPGFFSGPSLEMVRRRIQQLGDDDLARQTWIIEASFTSMLIGTDQSRRILLRDTGLDKEKSPRLKAQHAQVSRERLIGAAYAIGDRLCHEALRKDDFAGWLGVVPLKDREWHLTATGIDLYDGSAGIVLFLAHLAAVTGESRHLALAQAALNTVRSILEGPIAPAVLGLGAFNGLASPIYLFTHLGALWNDSKLLHEAERLVEVLPDLIEKDDRLDIIGGAAGCIASLLSLYSVMPSARILEVAMHCGQHLLDRAQQQENGVAWKGALDEIPLTGFSHGAAGIAFSLLQLSEVSGEVCFREAAMGGMTYERSLFSARKQNWLDLREVPGMNLASYLQADHEEEHKFMMAWCHGAPGIGLGRLASLRHIDDAAIREEIDIALKATITEGFGRNHSLCHGDFGNLETLLVATQTLDNPRYREQLERITTMLIESIDTHGWVSGVPLGVESPGLMTGLSGIGFELLRLAEPEKVPSVLLLAPPTHK